MLPLIHLSENGVLKEGECDTTLTCDIKKRIKQNLHNCYSTAWLGEQSIKTVKAASFFGPTLSKYMSAEDVINLETELELDCVNLQLQLSIDSFQDGHPPPKKEQVEI